MPALPEVCPRCSMRTGTQAREAFFSGTVRSPIRAHTSGQSQLAQILVSQLFRSTGDDAGSSRTIVFTDSRDQAARTSAGINLNNFRDQVRQGVRQLVHNHVPVVPLLRRLAVGELQGEELELAMKVRDQDRLLWAAVKLEAAGSADDDDRRLITSHEAAEGGFSWPALIATITSTLVAHGINPAGPGPSMADVGDGTPWYRAFPAPQSGLWATAERSVVADYLADSRRSSAIQVAAAIFDRAGRDSESTQVGYVDVASGLNPTWPLPDETAADPNHRGPAARPLKTLRRRQRRGDLIRTEGSQGLSGCCRQAPLGRTRVAPPGAQVRPGLDPSNRRRDLELRARSHRRSPLLCACLGPPAGSARIARQSTCTRPPASARTVAATRLDSRNDRPPRRWTTTRGWQRSPCAVWPSPS